MIKGTLITKTGFQLRFLKEISNLNGLAVEGALLSNNMLEKHHNLRHL
jgi:hypothetical protein